MSAERAKPQRVKRSVTEAGAVHDEREIEAVVEVLRTTTLELGERIDRFERSVAELLAKRHGVLVNSGTSALRLAIDLLGCEPGDEVITSVVTFSSDVAPLVQSGIVPVFVDVEPGTYTEDAGDPRAEPRGQLSRLGSHPRDRRSSRPAGHRGQL